MATTFDGKGRPSRQDALDYHSSGRKGKIEVVPIKPVATSRDLSLAYSPGVAEPCLEIAQDPDLSYKYTIRGNLIAVITNGTAVLGDADSRLPRRPARHRHHHRRGADQRAGTHPEGHRAGEGGLRRRGRGGGGLRGAIREAGRAARARLHVRQVRAGLPRPPRGH